MKLQGNYNKMNLEINFTTDVCNESYENGELDYIYSWDCKENFIIENDIKDIVNSIENFIENYLYYDWEILKGVEYDDYIKRIDSSLLVNKDNRELSESEYEEFKNGKNMFTLNFSIRLKINGKDIDDKDLKSVIEEIQKTFEK